jgi:hypothetical protein
MKRKPRAQILPVSEKPVSAETSAEMMAMIAMFAIIANTRHTRPEEGSSSATLYASLNLLGGGLYKTTIPHGSKTCGLINSFA